jgi:hypothetical protein
MKWPNSIMALVAVCGFRRNLGTGKSLSFVRSHMIFAFATDDKTLMVFPNGSEAIAYCEGVDVEEGNWLFFDGEGNPLDAVFTTPNKHGSFSVVSGVYILQPSAEVSVKSLLDQLGEVAAVEGKPPLNSVAEIKKLLTLRSSGDAPSARPLAPLQGLPQTHNRF